MVAEEVFESSGRKISIFHGHGLPGEGVILLHRAAARLECAAEVVTGQCSGLRLSVGIVIDR